MRKSVLLILLLLSFSISNLRIVSAQITAENQTCQYDEKRKTVPINPQTRKTYKRNEEPFSGASISKNGILYCLQEKIPIKDHHIVFEEYRDAWLSLAKETGDYSIPLLIEGGVLHAKTAFDFEEETGGIHLWEFRDPIVKDVSIFTKEERKAFGIKEEDKPVPVVRSEIRWKNVSMDSVVCGCPTEGSPHKLIFLKSVDFRGSTFLKAVGFGYDTFAGIVDFSKSSFNTSNFHNVMFNSSADFKNATFNGESDFYNTIFGDFAEFQDTTFNGKSDFSLASFSNIALFSSVTFNGESDFSRVKFAGKAFFTYVKFAKNADFSTAKFAQNADFLGVKFAENSDFSDVRFAEYANFPGIKFSRGTSFIRAYLRKANLRKAELQKAILINADLSKADLREADLKDCILDSTTQLPLIYEPIAGSPPYIPSIADLPNLSELTFNKSAHGLVDLREGFKKLGYRQQEREITYAIKHTKRHKLWNDKGSSLWNKAESLFYYIFFEITCKYGMNPGRPIVLLIPLIIIFAIPYTIVLKSPPGKDGIWKVWIPERARKDLGAKDPYRLYLKLYSALGFGFYFSMLSAFSIGWRELNVGNWIARIQRREYTLRATGWVRTVSGIQSLISVYLVALWVLSYFGRPFDAI